VGAALVAGFALACGSVAAPSEQAADALNRGIQAQNAGRSDEATADYFETLRADPKNKYAFYNLGQIARVAKRYAAAEAYYRLALENDPKFAAALFGLAYVRAAAGASAEAIDLYQQAVRAEPDNAAAHYNLGLLLRAAGREAEGDSEIARGRSLDPNVGPLPDPSRVPSPSPTSR
jgi:tetratricopeptide (TPR) repeat protein